MPIRSTMKGDSLIFERAHLGEMFIRDWNYSTWYSVPMARVAEIAQNATAHWGDLLTPTVTSDAQLSWYLQCAPNLNFRLVCAGLNGRRSITGNNGPLLSQSHSAISPEVMLAIYNNRNYWTLPMAVPMYKVTQKLQFCAFFSLLKLSYLPRLLNKVYDLRRGQLDDALSKQRNMVFPQTIVLHHLLIKMIKQATMCMNQRPIKRRNMHVDGFDKELHKTRIQYKNLNMHNHSLPSKGIQHQ
jgi:hypothetical protein